MATGADRLPAIARAMELLADTKLAWAVLRGGVDGPGVREIDVLVEPRQAAQLDQLLASVGYARIRVWGHEPHRFFVAYDAGADAWVKLDVITEMTFASGYRLDRRMTRAVLRRRCAVDGYRRLAPADEFWAQLLHSLLDRGWVEPDALGRLQQLLVQSDISEGPMYARLARDPEARDCAVDLVRRGDDAALEALAGRLADCLEATRPAFRAWQRAARMATPVMKAVRRPGLTVAMLGPDGSGKSTLISSLANGFYLPTRAYHLGMYGTHRPRLGPLSRIPGLSTTVQLGRLWLAYAAGAVHRRRGRLVLFDRHGWEALAPARGVGSWKGRLRRVAVARLSPAPDLVLVLDAPPATLYARKQEHSESALAVQRRAYRALVARLAPHGRARLLDAAREPLAVKREATALIWQQFVARR